MADSPLSPATLLTAMVDRVNALRSERRTLLARLAQIDETLRRAAQELGLDAEALSGPNEAPEEKVDGRRAGSMMEYILQIIANAPQGITRGALKAIVREHEEFGPKVVRNENGFYNAVKRAVVRGEIVDRGGLLYVPAKAPAEGAETPPSNVTLFGKNVRDA